MKSYSKITITSIIAAMAISSPIFMLVNPHPILAATATDTTNRIGSSNYHATSISETPSTSSSSAPSVTIPSTISQDGDFTTQAALQHPLLLPSNNIVNTRATYDIGFRTTTAGVIKTIEMVFPAGTVASNSLIDFAGIGPGLLTRPTVDSLLYTVFNPVNVPANTVIRFEVGFFNNPANPISAATAQVTTRDTTGNIIDGPTNSNPYTIKQVGTHDIADSAVTTPKIADGSIGTSKIADDAITEPKIADNSITSTMPTEPFMKRVTLLDNAAGNALGWNPNGAGTEFVISEPNADPDTAFVSAFVTSSRIAGGNLVDTPCRTAPVWPGGNAFIMRCGGPGAGGGGIPPEGSELHYMVTNLPAHVS